VVISQFLDEVFAYYRGGGVEGTGRRLAAIRNWLSMAGRTRAVEALRRVEEESGGASERAIAESLWMSASSYRGLKRWVSQLPSTRWSPQL